MSGAVLVTRCDRPSGQPRDIRLSAAGGRRRIRYARARVGRSACCVLRTFREQGDSALELPPAHGGPPPVDGAHSTSETSLRTPTRCAGGSMPWGAARYHRGSTLARTGLPWRRTLLLTLCNWILLGITRAKPPYLYRRGRQGIRSGCSAGCGRSVLSGRPPGHWYAQRPVAARASSTIYPATRATIRDSTPTITSPRCCQPHDHHRRQTNRSATHAPFGTPQGAGIRPGHQR